MVSKIPTVIVVSLLFLSLSFGVGGLVRVAASPTRVINDRPVKPLVDEAGEFQEGGSVGGVVVSLRQPDGFRFGRDWSGAEAITRYVIAAYEREGGVWPYGKRPLDSVIAEIWFHCWIYPLPFLGERAIKIQIEFQPSAYTEFYGLLIP